MYTFRHFRAKFFAIERRGFPLQHIIASTMLSLSRRTRALYFPKFPGAVRLAPNRKACVRSLICELSSASVASDEPDAYVCTMCTHAIALRHDRVRARGCCAWHRRWPSPQSYAVLHDGRFGVASVRAWDFSQCVCVCVRLLLVSPCVSCAHQHNTNTHTLTLTRTHIHSESFELI